MRDVANRAESREQRAESKEHTADFHQHHGSEISTSVSSLQDRWLSGSGLCSMSILAGYECHVRAMLPLSTHYTKPKSIPYLNIGLSKREPHHCKQCLNRRSRREGLLLLSEQRSNKIAGSIRGQRSIRSTMPLLSTKGKSFLRLPETLETKCCPALPHAGKCASSASQWPDKAKCQSAVLRMSMSGTLTWSE